MGPKWHQQVSDQSWSVAQNWFPTASQNLPVYIWLQLIYFWIRSHEWFGSVTGWWLVKAGSPGWVWLDSGAGRGCRPVAHRVINLMEHQAMYHHLEISTINLFTTPPPCIFVLRSPVTKSPRWWVAMTSLERPFTDAYFVMAQLPLQSL